MVYVLRYEAGHFPEDSYTMGVYSSCKVAEEVRDSVATSYPSLNDRAKKSNYSIEVFDIEGEEE